MSSLESTATFAQSKSKSLRATIPDGIVAFLGIEKGDTLLWTMEFRDGRRFVEVRKKSK
jgi:hypothetical protein